MIEAIYSILATIEYNNPVIFWLFVGMLGLAVAFTYAYNLKAGLLTTFIVSGLLYVIGEFIPYIYIPVGISAVLFLLEIFGFTKLERMLRNLSNWIYLRYRIKRNGHTSVRNKS